MQERDYCRQEHFLSNEKHLLQPLPDTAFEIKYYKEYKLTGNNHIYLGQDKHYYSAPYQHISKKLKVVYTRSMVHIFCSHNLIAVHKRSFVKGAYTTDKNHLCSTHQHYLNRSPEYYQNKARSLCEPLGKLVELIFSQNRYPEQLYRGCDGLFSLQRNTHQETFNKACQIAIEYQNYSYGFVHNIIKNKMTEATEENKNKALPGHNNIRGREYYNKQLPFKFLQNEQH